MKPSFRLAQRNAIVRAYIELPTEKTIAGLAELFGLQKSYIRHILIDSLSASHAKEKYEALANG